MTAQEIDRAIEKVKLIKCQIHVETPNKDYDIIQRSGISPSRYIILNWHNRLKIFLLYLN